MPRKTTEAETPQSVETPETSPQVVTQVLAEVEFRKFDRLTGERLSKPFNQYYVPEEWEYLKKHGPRMGLFVNRVIEAPAGTDTSYPNPR